MKFIAAIIIVFWFATQVHADVTGIPRIVDGDTIHIAGTKVRLHGIDSPEKGQKFFMVELDTKQ